MKMRIDERLCSGHGRCARYAPELFPLDDAGFNTARGRTVDVPAGEEANAGNALRSCPERAITVVEA